MTKMKMNRDLRNGTNVPFFGEVLVESPPVTALGATIFTAALADCGLVKKAMVGREVQKKRAGRRPIEWRTTTRRRGVNRHPQTAGTY